MCVCEYHKNIHLILSVLENHTSLSSMFDDFAQQVTCNQTCKDCIYRRCDSFRDLLETFKAMEFFSQNISSGKHAIKGLRRFSLLLQWMLFLMI